jgi:fructose-1,6-bisphosphatase/inositol monophosphatase family enzyme
VSIAIRRNGEFSSMQVPVGVPIEITARADMSAEAVAWQVLQDAGFGPEIIGETYG